MNLTPRQSDTLEFIAAFQAERGFGPSYRDIAKGIGLTSIGRVYELLIGLEERGAIRRLANRARSVEIVKQLGPVAEAHLRAVLGSFSANGILFDNAPAVIEAMRYLERRSQ